MLWLWQKKSFRCSEKQWCPLQCTSVPPLQKSSHHRSPHPQEMRTSKLAVQRHQEQRRPTAFHPGLPCPQTRGASMWQWHHRVQQSSHCKCVEIGPVEQQEQISCMKEKRCQYYLCSVCVFPPQMDPVFLKNAGVGIWNLLPTLKVSFLI